MCNCIQYTVSIIFSKNSVFWIQNTVSNNVSPIYYIIFYAESQLNLLRARVFREKYPGFPVFCSNLLAKAMKTGLKGQIMSAIA